MAETLYVLHDGARAGHLVRGDMSGSRLVYDSQPYEVYELTDETIDTPHGRARVMRGRPIEREGDVLKIGP